MVALVVLVAMVPVPAALAQRPPPALSFKGNRILPREVYLTVLGLAARANNGMPVDLPGAKGFVEIELTRFLRDSGYLLATVEATPNDRGGLTITVDEGHLDRVIVLGEGVVRTLQIQLYLDLPQGIFNRFTLERQLAELVRDRDFDEASYSVVPMEQVDHLGIQLTPSQLLGFGSKVSPGVPHELHISLRPAVWRTGFGQGLGFRTPDGLFLSASYRDNSLIVDNDRLFTELQVAFRSFEALASSNKQVGFSRVESINRFYGPPLMVESLRPTLDLNLALQSRFRADLDIKRYFFAPVSVGLSARLEVTRGLEIGIGGGVQYRSLFDVEPESGVTLEVRTEEQTLRVFGGADLTWSFEPDALRQDRQDTLSLRGVYYTGPGDQFDGFAKLLGRYEHIFEIGYDELRCRIDGALLLGDVPFYDEVALGDGFVRLGYSGDFFTRQVASLSFEYRLSLDRDTIKLSLFNDAAVFDELEPNRDSIGPQFSDSVGLGIHFLILNTFQLDFYGGVGFVPELDPAPGVALAIRQAF